MLICTIFTAAGQYFFKKASETLVFNLDLFLNYNLIFGLFFYAIGAFLLVYALRFGELNTLYPIVSLTFIWVTMISVYVLNESISFSKISGITTIIGGVFLIQRGGK